MSNGWFDSLVAEWGVTRWEQDTLLLSHLFFFPLLSSVVFLPSRVNKVSLPQITRAYSVCVCVPASFSPCSALMGASWCISDMWDVRDEISQSVTHRQAWIHVGLKKLSLSLSLILHSGGVYPPCINSLFSLPSHFTSFPSACSHSSPHLFSLIPSPSVHDLPPFCFHSACTAVTGTDNKRNPDTRQLQGHD